MREDIKKLLETRPIWREINDPVLRDLKLALELARAERDTETASEIEAMIEQQKNAIN